MTPPGAAARDERPGVRRRPAGRKTMIVAAARRLAVDGGLAAVSMEDIASELNITAGALYRHFPGKVSIVEAVVADTMERFAAAAEEARREAVERASAPAQVLGALVASAVQLGLDDPSLLRVQTRQWEAAEGSTATEAERRMARTWTAELLAAVPGLSPAQARIRQAGVLGALAATTWRAGTLPRPALDGLLSAAASAVLLHPAGPGTPASGGAPARRLRGWRPEPTRRDQILAAALDLFRARGFGGTTVEDIGRAVDLSASGIYRSYRSKADILLDAYDRAAARVEMGTERALASASDPLDALRRLMRSYAAVAADNTNLIVVTSRESAALPAGARPYLARRSRALRDVRVPALRQVRAGLTEPEAHLLLRGALALANQAVLSAGGHQVGSDEIAELMVAFLLAVPGDREAPGPAPSLEGKRRSGAARRRPVGRARYDAAAEADGEAEAHDPRIRRP